MATLKSDSMRMYSWWWDSHISPKNSKWLQENLTDIDGKVKLMIKLIEEDADSFAKRAEMYYKKRPELMKLVEEFYRAYRALAERYDHATGALRQAHHTMAEAFPNQVTFPLADDSLSSDLEPHTSEIRKKGFKQLTGLFGSEEGSQHYEKFGEGRSRIELNRQKGDRYGFMHTENADQLNHMKKENLKAQVKSSSELACTVDVEIQTLKDSLAKLEAEKTDGFLQYNNDLERLSYLEEKVFLAQEDARGFNERASKAETEVQTLNEALIKLQAEKEASYFQYKQCLERMSDLEKTIPQLQENRVFDERAIKAETEAQSLKEALARVEVEKSATLLQYKQCLEKISNLESKILLAEENARILSERADRAETEVQFLKEAIAKLEEEKKVAAVQYQNSLDTISALQDEVSHAQEEATRLSSVIVMGVAKLNTTEDQYLQLERENQSLQTEIDTLLQMMTLQKQEFSEKREELDRLQNCIDEECSRSLEAEAALQTLQNVHSQCQEEREALLLKIENVDRMLKDKENEYCGLEEESQHVKEDHKILSEQKMSLSIAERNLQDEIFRLREAQVKLDEEIKVLMDQKNALQQEVYGLKESLDDLQKKYLYVIEQMELVGLNPDCLGSSVKTLHEENSRLKEICQKDNDEKESLLKKLKNMENLPEKNAHLENSLLDVNAGLELLREKVKALEETYQSLKRVNSTVVAQKDSLISELDIANTNVEKFSEYKDFLVDYIFDANVERAWLKEKTKSLEEFCQSLDHEKRDIFSANNILVSQFKSIQQTLNDMGRKYTDLEEDHVCLEKEMGSKIHQLKELKSTLTLEKQEHASLTESCMTQLAHLEEEGKRRRKEFEDEQDKAVNSQLEIFILQRFIRDMEERNLTLFTEYQKHLETSRLVENLVMNLEKEKLEQQVKFNSLLDQVEKLSFAIRHAASSLKVSPAYGCQDKIEEDQILLQQATQKIEELDNSLWSTEDEKHQLLFEKSVFLALLSQLRLEAATIESENTSLDRNLKLRTEDLLLQQSEKNKLKCASDHLYRQIRVGKDILGQKEMELSETKQELRTIEIENMELYRKLKDMGEECERGTLTREVLEEQILNISEINASKNKEIVCLHEATENLELEVNSLHDETKQQRVKEGKLSSELQQKRNEINLWEYEAETLYRSGQVTSILAALFEDKVWELVGTCESLTVDRDSKTEDIKQLKERLDLLEVENKEVKSELVAYLPLLVSLRDSVTALEYCVIPQTMNFLADNQETELADLGSHQNDSKKEPHKNQSLLVADGVSDLLELQTRIKKIETSVAKQKTLLMQEFVDKDVKLEAAMKEIQKLEQARNESSNRKLHHSEHYSSEAGNEVLVKDIPLDQVSQCSSYDHGFVPYTMSKRDHSDRIDEIVESWGTEQDFGFDLMFNQEKKSAAIPTQDKGDFLRIKTMKDKGKCPSSEIQSEEKGALSKIFTSRQQGSNKKILERLASDSQKLSNLQVTGHDLHKKMEQLEKFKKPNDTEFITMKERLMEVEEAIRQLVGTIGKLSKKAEGQSRTSDEKVNVELKGAGKMQRCIISERARRGSEKIGRLQLEVQRIHFLMLQLEDRYKTKDDRKVLLKDYIYGNLRSPAVSKQKKRLCFSCVKPTTKVDYM